MHATCCSLEPDGLENAQLPLHISRRRLRHELASHASESTLIASSLLQLGLIELQAATQSARRAARTPRSSSPPPPDRRLPEVLARILPSTETSARLQDRHNHNIIAPAAVIALELAVALNPNDTCRARHALGASLLPLTGDYSQPPALDMAVLAGRHLMAAASLHSTGCPILHLKAATLQMRARLMSDTDLAAAFGRAAMIAPASRAAAQHYITALQWSGQDVAAAAEARRTINSGLWGLDPWQRPVKYTHGLRARRYWSAADVSPGLCTRLRAARKQIAAEADGMLNSEKGHELCEAQAEGLHTHNTTWRVCDVLRRCDTSDSHVVAHTCKALRDDDEHGARYMSAQFSWLHGGGHIRSHTGPSNARLVLHFTPDEPGGAMIRVGSSWRWRRFKRGGCMVMDDSFEHEVIHPGRQPRVNLVVQMAHPDIHVA